MKKITIHNLRCYEEKHIEFRRGINLLIGDNASGKTSLVRACNLVANSFLCGFSDENTNWKSVDDSDFRFMVGDNNTVLPKQPVAIEFTLSESDILPITLSDGRVISFNYEKYQQLLKNSPKNSRNLVSGLKDLKEYAQILYSSSHINKDGNIIQLNALPIYACFTTEDIHASRKIDATHFKEYAQMPSFGYYESYDCRGLLEYWYTRMLVLQEADDNPFEINVVRKAIKEALGENGCNIINDIIVRPNKKKVYFKYVDGRIVESSMLSDGYKRLVNIVIDLAIRCFLLNNVKFGIDCCRETHGTVIIDEIDEHLHPALQSKVLKILHQTFPKIQFIVTTHAPLVMSSVEKCEDNVVYRLWYDEEEKTYKHQALETYGLDSNLLLEESMLVSSRDPYVEEMIEKIQKLVGNRNLEEAKILLKELEAKTASDQPTLIRIHSVINRLESRNNEVR